eukprot:TRINITY_DN8758_c0_g1_i1.p1 TRINITY_DN8758_c0_g1~~TRINITY_DN8758_c0_g1_i1.p1  ORF type:complete len:216 (-),score=39.35 TRINITY_DN8758_c0_g1_i1:6-626(-)
MDIVGNFALTGTLMCHVILISLRSKAFVQATGKWRVIFLGFLGFFHFSNALYPILNAAWVLTQSTELYIANMASALIGTLMLTVIDVISTVVFAWRVYEINAQLVLDGNAESVSGVHQTQLIAKRGMYLSLYSTAGTVLYCVYWGMTLDSAGRCSLVVCKIVYLLVRWCVVSVAVAWMSMKIELDNMQTRQAEQSLLNAQANKELN